MAYGRMRCPLRVIKGHGDKSAQCLLYPQKRTLFAESCASAKCQEQKCRGSTTGMGVPLRCDKAPNEADSNSFFSSIVAFGSKRLS